MSEKKVKKEVKSARTQPFMRNPLWDERDKLYNDILKEAINTLKWIQTYFEKLIEDIIKK